MAKRPPYIPCPTDPQELIAFLSATEFLEALVTYSQNPYLNGINQTHWNIIVEFITTPRSSNV